MFKQVVGVFLFLVICVLQIFYFKAEHRPRKKNYFLLQIGSILLFSFIMILSISSKISPSDFRIFFFFAISFSFLGDLLMDGKIKITGIKLVDGITGFSFAHILYIIGLAKWLQSTRNYFEKDDLWLLSAVVIIGLIGYYFTGFNFSKKSLKIAGAFYAILLGGTLFMALLVGVKLRVLPAIIVLIGAILFFVSDLTLAYREANKPSINLDPIVHFSYVFGQLLLQTGVFFFI